MLASIFTKCASDVRAPMAAEVRPQLLLAITSHLPSPTVGFSSIPITRKKNAGIQDFYTPTFQRKILGKKLLKDNLYVVLLL